MRDAGILQLRPAIRHHVVQQGGANVGMDGLEAGAAAVHHPPVTRQQAVIAGDARTFGNGPAVRNQFQYQIFRQFLCHDDLAGNRHDAAAQLRTQCPGIGVGRHDHLLRAALALAGREREGAPRAVHMHHFRVRAERHPGAVAGLQQALVEQRGMQLSCTLDHHTAVIEIAADLVALRFPGDHPGAHLDYPVQHIRLLRHVAEMRRRIGSDKAAPALEMAFDALALDDGLDELVGRQAFRQESLDQVARAAGLARAAGKTFDDIDSGTDAAAGTRAGAFPEGKRIRDRHLAPFARQLQGGGKTGIAAADDQNLGAVRQIGGMRRAGARRLPPIGFGLVVGMKQGAVDAHPKSPYRSPKCRRQIGPTMGSLRTSFVKAVSRGARISPRCQMNSMAI